MVNLNECVVALYIVAGKQECFTKIAALFEVSIKNDCMYIIL